MTQTNTVARSLHDVGLAAWFGGALMGAVGVNGASQEVGDPKDRVRVANAGWGKWTPVNALAIGAHLIGGVQLLSANKGRTLAQENVGTWTGIKTGATLAALAATGYSRLLGQKVMEAEADAARQSPLPSEGLEASSGVEPSSQTPPDVAKAQNQLRILQWVIPALTGVMIVANARMGEQQRPKEVVAGLVNRLNPLN